jgi:hypothetical protein
MMIRTILICRRTAGPLMAGLILVLATGCSSFHTHWKAALKVPPPTDDITGPWEGHWISSANGHSGKLRCLMTKPEEGKYHAWFWGTFWECFRFTYEVDLNVQRTDTAFILSGEQNLGKLVGGVYRYNGSATPTNFFANYSCTADHGVFQMHRPTAPDPQ